MINLREYQKLIVHYCRESFRKGNNFPLVQLPTGGGKSIIFCWIVSEMQRNNKRCLILTHRQELLIQIFKHLRNFDIEPGIIKSGFDSVIHNPIQIASVQTLANRLELFNENHFDLIISDEHHHAVTESQWGRIIEFFKCRKIGFTATPIRLDGQGLGISKGGFCDDLIQGISVRELISEGFLVEPKVYAPVMIDLTGVKTIAGDFDKKEINYRIDKPSITGDALENYRKYASGRKAVIFCTSIKHAENVAVYFNKNRIPAHEIHGESKNREEIMQKFSSGEIQILTNCDLIGEGVDIPDISCVIMLRPTKSESLFLQQAGRGLRLADGKNDCIILDHVGNTMRHGHPIADREWSLEGRKKRKKADDYVAVNQCEKCYYVYPSAVSCPSCRHIKPVQPRKIKEKSGELAEIAAEKKHKRMQIGMARDRESLEKIAKERGYKAGWVDYILKSRDNNQILRK
jgi:superfamily II DNA or RNA helicase